MAHKVFLSHSSKDKEIAETICLALESRGIECWLATRDVKPGESFMEAIVLAIRVAKVMVFVFTSHANESEEMKRELVLASQHRLVIIPVRTEDVLPDDALSYQFATSQWIDLFKGWEQQVDRLTSRIDGLIPKDAPKEAEPKAASQATNSLGSSVKVRNDWTASTPPALPVVVRSGFFARPKNHPRRRLLMALVLFEVVLIAIALSCTTTVPTGHAGVLWKRFAGPGIHCLCILPSGTVLRPNEIRNEGLTLILPWDKLLIYDLGSQSKDEKYTTVTLDGVSVLVEISIGYRLNRQSLPVLSEFIGRDYLKVLIREVGNQTRIVIPRYTTQELDSTKREEVQNKIKEQTTDRLPGLLDSYFDATASEQDNPEQYRPLIAQSIKIADTYVVTVSRVPSGAK